MINFPLTYRLYSKSTKGVKRLTQKERALLTLSDSTQQALIGILLGDGHLQKRSSTANTRFRFTQSTKHEEYFYLVHELFSDFLTESFTPYHYNSKFSVQSLHFVTMALPCFNYYHDLFYNSKKVKVVPSNISDLLTARGLAFWIMDDGSKIVNGLHLNTYAFSSPDIDLLLDVLKNKFNLKCSIHIKNGQYRIYISHESMDLLRSLVTPHMHTSM